MNKIRLNQVKSYFLDDLQPKYIMKDLLQFNVVTDEEKEGILKFESSEEQVEKLFEVLSSKGSKELEDFIHVLNLEDECGVYYPWLAKKLSETNFTLEIGKRKDLKDSVHKLLTDGGVPFQTNCLIPRQSYIKRIRVKLLEASSSSYISTSWVILHGMTGTGKSVLAAEAVRDNELIDRYFPDGVFWVPLGNLTDSNALGIKMLRLYQKILESRKDPESENKYSLAVENLNDLKDNLKKLVVNKKLLVVLDDVWENPDFNIAKKLNIGCPVLVTTKFPKIFDNFSQFCEKIECKNDLELNESRELLALYVKCKNIDDLPEVVTSICRKCKGSPFTLSHIGRWMAPFGNNIDRWEKLRKLLEGGLRSAMRRRHSSEDELSEIKNIIRQTLLPIEVYQDLFYDFVIFPEDVWVPTQVFTVLWNMDRFEVEETMLHLVERSLVQFEKDPVYSYSYGIHDLYLELLKEICRDTKERHLRLVNNYLTLCKGDDGSYDFSRLPDDDYIHYYIGHHMKEGLINEGDIIDGKTIDDIYFDLSFIEKKLQKDPKDLLWDYYVYRDLFQNKELLEIFESFARKHAYTIFNNRDCDIIQLGLFEPQDSIIYNKSLDLAVKSVNKAYFQWCNQEENQSHMQNLNVKLNPFKDDFSPRHATISSDGSLVACVGNENKALIFSSSSGEELLMLSGHTAPINYCLFNSDRSKLVTASDDKTVRIFELNLTYSSDMKPTRKRGLFPVINAELAKTPDMSVVTFAQHHAPVLCCCYSNDEDLIVSSDAFGVAHVWQSTETFFKCSVLHLSRNKMLPVEVCCFNSDATFFATSSYDSIKLWFTANGEEYKEILHGDMVVKGFCFANDNLIISIADNKVYKHTEEKVLEQFGGSRNLVFTCCCLSPDKNYLACGTSENSVIVYNVNSDKLIYNLKGHKSSILSVRYTQDGKKLLAASEEGYILHDMSQSRDSSLISYEGNLSVQQNLDDITIALSNYFESIEVRKGITGQLLCKTSPDSSEITACSLSHDCSEVVYGTKDGKVKVFNIEKGVVNNLPKHSLQINYIIHSKSSNLFFTCSEDKTIKIWNNRSSPKVLKGHQGSVLMCVPFKKSSKLLSCSKDGTLRVWDIDTGEQILVTEGHGNQDIRCCDISADDKILASASADRTIKLWKAENGDLYKTLDCKSEVRSCRFSPQFQILISGCDSGEVRLWNYSKKISSDVLCNHSSCVYNIYFRKDGRQFLSISDDIKIWTIGQPKPQTLLLPSYYMGVARPSIWASDNFDIFVIILNSVLYVLKKL